MRTEQDKINRKEANQRYYKLEENKQQKREYMKSYCTRDYVKAKAHEYYVKNKAHWGEITKAKEKKTKNWGGIRQENEDIKRLHEEWAKANGYRDNDLLHATNTERLIKDAKK
tara:strand:+ start:16 stop:354 length:339 start_codon:yes stop_codon:yes gene_type:complete